MFDVTVTVVLVLCEVEVTSVPVIVSLTQTGGPYAKLWYRA